MKLRINKHLREALLACMAAMAPYAASEAQAGNIYMAEGVDAQNIMNSERFYDNGKGYYWNWKEHTPFIGATELYESTGSYEFLGDLAGRISTSSGITTSSFNNLRNDSDTCWYNTSSNVIQYWQSYYGVFTDNLVYGHTYNREYADDLGGTQSLRVGMHFYDNWQNVGGNLQNAAGWYLNSYGEKNSYAIGLKNKGKGGFFSQYFEEESDCTRESAVRGSAPEGVAEALASHLGYEKQKDGSYKKVRVGQLAYLGFANYKGSWRSN